MNLIEDYRRYLLIAEGNRARAHAYIRESMKSNIGDPQRKPWRFAGLNFQTQYSIADLKIRLREFGESLADGIKRGDPWEVMDYFNRHFKRLNRHCRTNMRQLFEDRFGSEFIICHDCGAIEYAEESIYCYDDYSVCGSCSNEYRYSDSRGYFITADQWYEEEEEEDEDSGPIGEYHSTEIGHIPSDYDNRKPRVLLGMELEVEVSGADRVSQAESIMEAIGLYRTENGNRYEYCGLEHDGSLSHGFEIVTGYTGLDVHKNQLEIFKKPWRGLKSHDTKTCGLHVHLCKRGVTMLHAAKMIFFINESANMRLIRAIARRDSSSYASIKNKKAEYQWLKTAKKHDDPLSNLNEDRYEALNFKNRDTIEFRLFKGTLKYETIMACLEFAFATWHFTREAGMNELTIDGFLKFISQPSNRKDTHFLRDFLASKNFDLPKVKHLKIVKRETDMEFENQTAIAA